MKTAFFTCQYAPAHAWWHVRATLLGLLAMAIAFLVTMHTPTPIAAAVESFTDYAAALPK